MQLEVVAGMPGLAVGEIPEADAGRDHLRPDLDVLCEEACLADRAAVTGADSAGRFRRFRDQGRAVIAGEDKVDVAVVFVDRRRDCRDYAVDAPLGGRSPV
jgi:hypothetical protein